MSREGYRASSCRQCGAPRHTVEKRAACKDCLNREARDRRARKKAADPQGWAAKKRSDHLKYTFGITLEDFDRMLGEQGGGCALCSAVEPGGSGDFKIDHDHATGKVRALLCNLCNIALGSARDDPSLLRRMADYIEAHHNG